VVASNTSSIPEVVGDAALLIAPDDVDGLVVAMWHVLSDPGLWAELRAKGLQRAQMFSWEKAAHETLAVYHRAAKVR
jgi:glycosyltransferase involved in cell wall biosynthesis